MPTQRCGWVRRALRDGYAKVISRVPFTIQLLYDSTRYTQEISLGVDAGSKTIGLSATTKQKEVFAAEVILRNDITDLLSTRRLLRRTRRNRKTRYRKARFDNRKKSKGCLAPSVRWKVEAHKRAIRFVFKILPISKIVIETAQFDIQKIKNPEIQSKEYQEGDQLGFQNVKEYVLWRDEHKCQICGKSECKLHVHHIETRKTGGNAPNNLVTLCLACHERLHQGLSKLKKKRGKSFRDASAMTIMRPTLLRELRAMYPTVEETFGYVTKFVRQKYGIEKSHVNDARCISGHPFMAATSTYLLKFVRRHNRQIHKLTVQKGGDRKRNNAGKFVFGFQLFDMVRYKDKIGFVFGRRQRGCFDIRHATGQRICETSYKKLKIVKKCSTMLIERRCAG